MSPKKVLPKQAGDEDEVFTILRAAVTLAKEEQIKTAQNLRSRICNAFPGREDQVDRAIKVWSNRVKQPGGDSTISKEYRDAVSELSKKKRGP